MPPFSRTIEEEGVLFECFPLVAAGELRERELRAALAAGPWPARNVPSRTSPTCARSSRPTRAASPSSSARCAARARRACTPTCGTCRTTPRACVRAGDRAARPPGSSADELDDGAAIAVRIDIDRGGRRARVDFTGTSAAGRQQLQRAARGGTAAALYVFRMPGRRGRSRSTRAASSRSTSSSRPARMLDPRPPAAVAAGNVETSQCIVDALLRRARDTGRLARAR